jgi:hypothetical protein
MGHDRTKCGSADISVFDDPDYIDSIVELHIIVEL